MKAQQKVEGEAAWKGEGVYGVPPLEGYRVVTETVKSAR